MTAAIIGPLVLAAIIIAGIAWGLHQESSEIAEGDPVTSRLDHPGMRAVRQPAAHGQVTSHALEEAPLTLAEEDVFTAIAERLSAPERTSRG